MVADEEPVPLIQKQSRRKFDLTDFFSSNRNSFIVLFTGLILIGVGVLLYKTGFFEESVKVEVIGGNPKVDAAEKKQIFVEVSGAIEKPGVYKFEEGTRVDELLIASGGLSADADREWVDKYINRAAKLSDGQKIYILKVGKQSDSSTAKNIWGIKTDQEVLGVSEGGLVNVNTASLSELDTLPGIGQVYGQSIIEHRPYSSLEELVEKGAIKQNVFEKIKDQVTAY